MSDTTIWKFSLPITDTAHIDMPAGAHVLAVQSDNNSALWLWASVNPQATTERRVFYVRGTGHPLGQAQLAVHVGTVVANSGLVWHIFDAHPSPL